MAVAFAVGAHVPNAIRELSTLDRVDYVDTATADVAEASARSPEVWGRAVMERTALGRRAPLLWTTLGLRLGPRPSPDHIQGWRIAARGDDWIRVDTRSWYARAEAVCRVEDGRVSMALFLHYDRPIAAVIWAVIGPLHRRGLPAMVREAVRQ